MVRKGPVGPFEGAAELQRRLAQEVRLCPLAGEPRWVAGVDCSERDRTIRAAAVLLSWPELTPAAEALFEGPCRVPYVPGFLSFRELDPMVRALEGLGMPFDLVMVDGCGIAHPRGLGIASHLGVALNVPSLGISKSLLVGSFEEPGPDPLSIGPIWLNRSQVGWALRSRRGARPIFVTPGHMIDLEGALDVTLRALRGYRLPEPTRLADLLSKGPCQRKKR
ncbi:endonuclease V [Thermanaerovibrio acidaminovorans]|jgi:deoxyribonuclease V|uniref:endonuclease V n=1 Tax=Thermanaerovibrio acidaminovorans TaxID=81462 RepID=UPI0024937025|nr:endonuclease V [Thermanaerovibrio acidaminovorans]